MSFLSVAWAPVIGVGPVDGFAIGVLVTGACALAITGPRRARVRRDLGTRDGGTPAARRNEWLCEHVMAAEEAVASEITAEVSGARTAAEAPGAKAVTGSVMPDVTTGAFGTGMAAGAFGPRAERVARPDELGAEGVGRPADGRRGTVAGGYRSRHGRS